MRNRTTNHGLVQRTGAGLDGVVAAETTLSHVDGEAGHLIIGGYPLEMMALEAEFEEIIHLLWQGRLPTTEELSQLKKKLAAQRTLPSATVNLLREAAQQGCEPMDALRMAAGTLDLDAAQEMDDEDTLAIALIARLPTVVAAYWRLRAGEEPVAPRADLGHAANYLYMLSGEEPDGSSVRGLETYLNTVVDHGLNASTFAARVIIATQSDMTSALVGAIGALKGPLHGGAPGPALDMVFEIGDASRTESYLREKLSAGERLMGFGHRIYKVRDPRAEVLAKAADALFADGSQAALFDLARAVEETAVRLLEEYKPGRRLQTNVEFYTALLLHGLGMETDLFTPTFAISRAVGWVAHCREQLVHGRLIRPRSRYVGTIHAAWTPINER